MESLLAVLVASALVERTVELASETFKRWLDNIGPLSRWFGLAVGIGFAFAGELSLFDAVPSVEVPSAFGHIVTGAAMGYGSEFLHRLLGLLRSSR